MKWLLKSAMLVLLCLCGGWLVALVMTFFINGEGQDLDSPAVKFVDWTIRHKALMVYSAAFTILGIIVWATSLAN